MYRLTWFCFLFVIYLNVLSHIFSDLRIIWWKPIWFSAQVYVIPHVCKHIHVVTLSVSMQIVHEFQSDEMPVNNNVVFILWCWIMGTVFCIPLPWTTEDLRLVWSRDPPTLNHRHLNLDPAVERKMSLEAHEDKIQQANVCETSTASVVCDVYFSVNELSECKMLSLFLFVCFDSGFLLSLKHFLKDTGYVIENTTHTQ